MATRETVAPDIIVTYEVHPYQRIIDTDELGAYQAMATVDALRKQCGGSLAQAQESGAPVYCDECGVTILTVAER